MRNSCATLAQLFNFCYNTDMEFNPKYKLTDKILTKLIEIAESRAIIERAKILPKNEIKLRRQAMIKMTQSSTEIEGNILSIKQVEAIAADKKVDAPDRDIYEVENYLSALKYIDQFIANKKIISEKTLLRVHKLVTDRTLPKDQSGHYRKSKIFVVRRRPSLSDEIVYTGPDAKNVPALCISLFQWLQKSQSENINPVIVAGILHQEIAAIHPFADGNGRTARAMATLLLYQRGYDFRRFFALEDYYNEDRSKYYQAINIGKNYLERKADFTSWLEYFIDGFNIEINNVKNQIMTFSLKGTNKEIGSKIYLDQSQMKVLGFIDQMARITAKDVSDILQCPIRTAQFKLNQLKKIGIIEQVGKGPSSAYVLK